MSPNRSWVQEATVDESIIRTNVINRCFSKGRLPGLHKIIEKVRMYVITWG